jgi:hypothetical protein
MALVDRLFGRNSPPRPQADLPGLQARLAGLVTRWAGRPPDPDLIRARLADGLRDAGLTPPTPDEFDGLARGLDDESWRRLAVLAGALDQEDVRAALPELAKARPPAELLAQGFAGALDPKVVRAELAELAKSRPPAYLLALGFLGVAQTTPLLTLDVLARGPLRLEELARRLLAGLGLGVRGEAAQASRERLERLDYGRLLAEAERAREAAAGRMEKLHKLQDEQEHNRARRGKW